MTMQAGRNPVAVPADRPARVAIVLSFALASLPMLLVVFPPVLDYPNHLARIWLLAGGAEHPPLSAMYQADWWQASTNIGMDFAAATLARVLPLAVLDKILQLILFLGPPLGGVFLNRAVFGCFHPWQIAFTALVWSTTAIAGFLNFQTSLAAALLCAVLVKPWLVRPALPRFTALTLSAAILLLIHPFGLLFFAALVTGLLIGEQVAWPVTCAWTIRRGRDIAFLAAACAVPLILLFLLAPHPPGAHVPLDYQAPWQGIDRTFAPGRILKAVASPFLSYAIASDALLAAPVFLILAWAVLTRQIRVHAGLLIVAGVLTVLAILAPPQIGDATWIQRRVPPMLALTLFAAVQPTFGNRRQRDILLTILMLTAIARTAWIGKVWLGRDTDVGQMLEAASHIPAGSAVIVVAQDLADTADAPLGRIMVGGPGLPIALQRHFPALAVIRYRFFIPTLFTVPGQQPLKVRAPWRSRSVYVSSIPAPWQLGQRSVTDPYVTHWRRDFDYLILVNADLPTRRPLSTTGLRAISNRHFVQVYKVLHTTGGADE